MFWTASKHDYLRLYAEAATAIKAVDERLLVGGPATAASEWVEDICAFCAETGTPLDFVSTHSYGNAPVDLGPSLRRHGFEKAQVWWTEWGVGHTHFHPIHDTAYAAPVLPARLQGRPGHASTRCPTGSSATTSRSSAARRGCCTAASAC